MNNFLTEWSKDLNSLPIGPLGVIAMAGCEEMGEKVNAWLMKWNSLQETQDEEFYTMPGVNRSTFLIKTYCPRFGTGESKGTIKESVRGYDIYIIVDVCAYNKTYKMYGQEVPMSPDDHFQDLKRIIAAIGGKAKRINVIMPMLYESRQHRRTSRESLDCALALQELEAMGVDNIITFDAHDPRVQNAIPLGGFENVMPTYQMIKALCRQVKDLAIDKENMMVVAPDEGAMQRNIYYSSVLGLDLGMFYKRRDYTTVVNGRNPIVAHEYLGAIRGGQGRYRGGRYDRLRRFHAGSLQGTEAAQGQPHFRCGHLRLLHQRPGRLQQGLRRGLSHPRYRQQPHLSPRPSCCVPLVHRGRPEQVYFLHHRDA